jgi:hypothetical protein
MMTTTTLLLIVIIGLLMYISHQIADTPERRKAKAKAAEYKRGGKQIREDWAKLRKDPRYRAHELEMAQTGQKLSEEHRQLLAARQELAENIKQLDDPVSDPVLWGSLLEKDAQISDELKNFYKKSKSVRDDVNKRGDELEKEIVGHVMAMKVVL